jgi:hypothetical protein
MTQEILLFDGILSKDHINLQKKYKMKWNVDPKHPTTIARLISDLEGVTYILECINEPEEYEYIQKMKQKYYKMYFSMLKEQ